VRILYLTSKFLWDRKSDRGRVHHVEAVARQPGIDLRLQCGAPGWPPPPPDWRADLLWVYDPPRKDRGWQFSITGLRDRPEPRILLFYDAYERPKVRAEIDSCDPALVIFAQESDERNWRAELEAEGRTVARIPNCAHKAVFYREGDWQRPIDCLLTGARNPDVYPLRERFARLVNDGKLPGEVRPFPGHRRKSIEDARVQFADYAAHLRVAKVALLDGSIHRLALQKYMEAAAAGCVMAGEMPDDRLFRDTLGKALVEIDSSMSDERIAVVIKDLLVQPAEMKRRSQIGSDQYLAGFTMEHWARRFLDAAGRVA